MSDVRDIALELRAVTKRYADVVAVDGATFQVHSGEIVSLLGPSGCGKTTTLRVIAGFERIDEGSVRIGGRDMRGLRPYERNVGLLFQDYALFPHMTVAENIAYGLRHRGTPRARVPARVAEMLELVKLEGLDGRYPGQLSGGQQQRVALARALATRPEIVLLDEPLSALDAKLRDELRVELKEILKAANATTIIVTHDQEEAMSLSDHIIVMNGGRIMQRGTPVEIYTSPKNKFVADFIGRSNWFSGRIAPSGSDGGYVFTSLDGQRFHAVGDYGGMTGACELGIRPERIRVTNGAHGEPGSPEGLNRITGRLTHRQFVGAGIHYWVKSHDGAVFHAVEQNIGQPIPAEGTEVALSFGVRDCVIVDN